MKEKIVRLEDGRAQTERNVFLKRVATDREGHTGDIVARDKDFLATALIADAVDFAGFPDEAPASAKAADLPVDPMTAAHEHLYG